MLAGLDVAAAALPLALIALLFFWIRRRYFSTRRSSSSSSSSSSTTTNKSDASSAAAAANQDAPKKSPKQNKRSKTRHQQQQQQQHKFVKLPLSEANENTSRTPASARNQTKPNIHLPIFHDQNEHSMTQEIKIKQSRSKMAVNDASSESDKKCLSTDSQQQAINSKQASLSETSLATTSTKNSPIHQEANRCDTRVEKQKSINNFIKVEQSPIVEPTAAAAAAANKIPVDINCNNNNNNHLNKMSILASSLKYSSVRLLKVECEARSLRLQTSSLQAALDTAKSELDLLKTHNSELQGFEKLLNNKQSEIQELKSMINDNFSQQNSNNDTIREQHKLIKNFETKLASMKFENQALISAKQTMEQELHDMKEKNKEIQAKLFETRQQLHQTKSQINGNPKPNCEQSDLPNGKRMLPGFENHKILDIMSYILVKTQSIDQKEKRELIPELFDRLNLGSNNSSERLRMQSLFTSGADQNSIVSKIDENLRHTLDTIVLINQNIFNSTLNCNRDLEQADAIELLNRELKLAALPAIAMPLSASNMQSSLAEWCAQIKNSQNEQTPVQSASPDDTLDYCGLRRQFLTDIVFEFANFLGVDIAQLPMPCSNTSTASTDADSHMKDWVCKLAVAIREN